ncbi:type IV pilus twitching motility protein PilT [bacterium]|nr:type IV pilus twitching motility protein PilT [candidate division CSSED10-310 bacterium]
MATIDSFLAKAVKAGASNIHIATGSPPLVRIHGDLLPISKDILSEEFTKNLIFEMLNQDQRKVLSTTRLELDFSYKSSTGLRFRVNIFRQRKGLDANFHVIPSRVPSLNELGLPRLVQKLAKFNQGLILVTGSAGCGKSSTLAGIIDYINRTEEKHIITVEDPIEFIHKNNKCMVNQREVGAHTKSFAIALRQALRADPDIILVGEMRDLETISMAITAAETGHLVLGTLHTLSASKTIDRIIDAFPGHQKNQIRAMVSESLRGVICQQLLKKPSGKGRILACEILLGTPPIANLIREGKTFQIPSVIQMNRQLGMQTMDDSLLDLLKESGISFEEAMLHAHDRRQFEETCRSLHLLPSNSAPSKDSTQPIKGV